MVQVLVYRTFTFVSPGWAQVQGTPAKVGENYLFQRTAEKEKLIVDWEDDNSITKENLNLAQKQALHYSHELDDRITTLEGYIDDIEDVVTEVTELRDETLVFRDESVAASVLATTAANTALSIADELSKSVFVYETYTEAQSASVHEDITGVYIKGYYTAGDGGNANYKRAVAEPAHAGKLQSVDGAWWELAESTVSPEMLGAAGDGVSNDTAFVQAALDCAAATGSIVNAFATYLCGPLVIRAPFNGGSVGKLVRASSSGAWLTLANGGHVVSFEIDGNWVAHRGFEIDRVNDVEILNNRISKIGELFIHFNGVTNLSIKDNTYVTGSNGISNVMPNDSPDALPSDGVRVVNNHIEDLAGSAIHFAGKQSASDENYGIANPLVSNSIVIGNTIKTIRGHGILVQARHNVVSTNNLEDVGYSGGNQGIVCQGRFLTVVGNNLNGGLGVGIDMGLCWHSTVVGNQVCNHAEIGIELQSCNTVTCSGNTVVSCGFGIAGEGSAGIAILQGFFGPSWTSTNVSVTGNTVSSGDTPGRYGISVGAGCKNNIVSGNSIVNSGTVNPKYIAPDAEVLFFGNLEDAGSTNVFALYGNPVITARSPSGNADIGLQPQGSGRLRIYQSFPSAATPANFVAQVMIEVKDTSGSSFFIPAKYGSGW